MGETIKISIQDLWEINMPSKIVYIVCKLVLVAGASILMFFVTMFNLLSKEQLKERLADNPFDFYFGKFLMAISVGLFFFLVSLVVNWFYRKQETFKTLRFRSTIAELIYYILFAILMTALFVRDI